MMDTCSFPAKRSVCLDGALSQSEGVRYSVIAAAATATTGMIDGSTERGGRERGREMEDRGSAATANAAGNG